VFYSKSFTFCYKTALTVPVLLQKSEQLCPIGLNIRFLILNCHLALKITFMFSDTLLLVHTKIVDANFLNKVTIFCHKCFLSEMQPQLCTRGKAQTKFGKKKKEAILSTDLNKYLASISSNRRTGVFILPIANTRNDSRPTGR